MPCSEESQFRHDEGGDHIAWLFTLIYTDPMGEVKRVFREDENTEVQLLTKCLQKAWLEAKKR